MLASSGKKADPSVSQEVAARPPVAQVGLTPCRRESSLGKGSKVREKTYASGKHTRKEHGCISLIAHTQTH